jgi:hypothetical protein
MLDKIVSVVNIVIVPAFVTVLTIVLNKTIWDIQRRLKKIEEKIFEDSNVEKLLKQIDDAIEYIVSNARQDNRCLLYNIYAVIKDDVVTMLANDINIKMLNLTETMLESSSSKLYELTPEQDIAYLYRNFTSKIKDIYKDAFNSKQIRVIKEAKELIFKIGEEI